MANRGRGTLTVRRSDNPFFQPSSQTVGEDFSEEIVYNAPTVERVGRPKKLEDDYEFGFLYKRASEDIGRGIDPSDSRLSRAMAQGDTLRDIAKMKTGGIEKPTGDDDGAPELSGTLRAERILDRYHHEPRAEHTMYQTTNNQYGIQRPTVATFTADRQARSQKFSNSFNGIKFRDQGLNTSLVRSTVHNSLDLF